MSESRLHLVLTMGDVNGVGPEIVAKALAEFSSLPEAELTVVGSRAALDEAARQCAVPPVSDRATIIEPSPPPQRHPGCTAREAGAFAAECVERGARMALNGETDALVTAPICKEALAMAGVPYPGHTDMLAAIGGVSEYRMMLVADDFRVVHVSLHISLRDAIDMLTLERVRDTILFAHSGTAQLGIDKPRVAVAALNPHAGEAGMFGTEEQDVILPAIALARAQGIDASGPHPCDTVFTRAHAGEFDVVVGMYHDQGHIPVKLVGFKQSVNITLGLPFIRTSVGHGTAFDIAGTGRADPSSLIAAIDMAATMVRHKSAE